MRRGDFGGVPSAFFETLLLLLTEAMLFTSPSFWGFMPLGKLLAALAVEETTLNRSEPVALVAGAFGVLCSFSSKSIGTVRGDGTSAVPEALPAFCIACCRIVSLSGRMEPAWVEEATTGSLGVFNLES